jgi:membrane associated rhomboid family serine protease
MTISQWAVCGMIAIWVFGRLFVLRTGKASEQPIGVLCLLYVIIGGLSALLGAMWNYGP